MVGEQDYAKLHWVYVPWKGCGAVLTLLQLHGKVDGTEPPEGSAGFAFFSHGSFNNYIDNCV